MYIRRPAASVRMTESSDAERYSGCYARFSVITVNVFACASFDVRDGYFSNRNSLNGETPMNRIIVLIATVILLFVLTPVQAGAPLYDCADNGEKICSDTVKTTRGYDPTKTEAEQCKEACVSEAARLGNNINEHHANGGVWACSATGSESKGVRTDWHGYTILYCSCDITCVKGLKLAGKKKKIDKQKNESLAEQPK